MSLAREVLEQKGFLATFDLPKFIDKKDVLVKEVSNCQLSGYNVDKVMVFEDKSSIFILNDNKYAMFYEGEDSLDVLKSMSGEIADLVK